MIETIFNKIAGVFVGVGMGIASLFGFSSGPELGAVLPQGVAVFETQLQSAITSSATSMTLASNSVRGGGTLSGYNCFTVDEGSAQAEFICGTVSGTSVTSLIRGVDPITATTTNATLQFSHRRGASVKVTDFPLVQIMRNQLNGSETIPNIINYTYSPDFTSASTSAIASIGYVQGIAFGSTPLGVTAGGTGATSLSLNMLLVGNGTGAVTATSSPTVGFITATSTSDTSRFSGNIVVTGTQNTIASTTVYTLNAGTVNATSTILLNGVAPALSADVQTFTASSTWTKPANAKVVEVYLFGAGGGGGSGKREAGAGVTAYGGSGGSGGGFSYKKFNASALGSTEAVVIGAGGAGGAGQTTNATNGNAGSAGGFSSFGTTVLVKAPGGLPGGGGTSAEGGASGGVGTQGNGDISQLGGDGGTNTSTGGTGTNTFVLVSPRGGGAGGRGDNQAGGVGGAFTTNFVLAGGATATIGNSPTSGLLVGGTGGGGSNGSGSGTSSAGGAGGFPGAGGGGSGASGGAGSGAGGAGGAGLVVVITYF